MLNIRIQLMCSHAPEIGIHCDMHVVVVRTHDEITAKVLHTTSILNFAMFTSSCLWSCIITGHVCFDVWLHVHH